MCARGKREITPGIYRTFTRTAQALSGSRATWYPHDFPNHWVKQQYLPDAIRDRVYYQYGPNKNEQAAKAYWDKIKQN